MSNTNSHKFINTMIALGAGLAVITAGLSALYKYTNPKISHGLAGLALAETVCAGAWVWMKDKSKQK